MKIAFHSPTCSTRAARKVEPFRMRVAMATCHEPPLATVTGHGGDVPIADQHVILTGIFMKPPTRRLSEPSPFSWRMAAAGGIVGVAGASATLSSAVEVETAELMHENMIKHTRQEVVDFLESAAERHPQVSESE